MHELPSLFLERLQKILPSQHFSSCLNSFGSDERFSVRINTLKAEKSQMISILQKEGIFFKEVDWLKDALLIENASRLALNKTDLVKCGQLYFQSLSSMLPALFLNPKPEERILDLCAAPGSKTTQIAALMKNEGTIVAIEKIKSRYYKLKAVTELLGVRNVSFKVMDARKFNCAGELFDGILVDAPCSSEGRFKTLDPKTFAYWSLRKIKEMAHKQKGLLLSASRLLKTGGVLIYSTCSFAPEENEAVIDWLLKKTGPSMKTEKIVFSQVPSYAPLLEWGKRIFQPQVLNCFRVLPDEMMEGFFIAKLIKII